MRISDWHPEEARAFDSHKGEHVHVEIGFEVVWFEYPAPYSGAGWRAHHDGEWIAGVHKHSSAAYDEACEWCEEIQDRKLA